ncbi:hypothetical protein CEXT_620231 [Caerostris extrusa]|uniref:Uncharacterized protein n=1 Tax=Caerostris extrusa TaxID=172846 RepID=A0AAV4WUU9_CAEEX|nr:hypothetical protein CEXT_620231 [Caerostris extrusa]
MTHSNDFPINCASERTASWKERGKEIISRPSPDAWAAESLQLVSLREDFRIRTRSLNANLSSSFTDARMSNGFLGGGKEMNLPPLPLSPDAWDAESLQLVSLGDFSGFEREVEREPLFVVHRCEIVLIRPRWRSSSHSRSFH